MQELDDDSRRLVHAMMDWAVEYTQHLFLVNPVQDNITFTVGGPPPPSPRYPNNDPVVVVRPPERGGAFLVHLCRTRGAHSPLSTTQTW